MESSQTLFQTIQTGDAAEVAAALENHPEWKSTSTDIRCIQRLVCSGVGRRCSAHMITDDLIPEARELAGLEAGLAAVVGVAVAFALHRAGS